MSIVKRNQDKKLFLLKKKSVAYKFKTGSVIKVHQNISDTEKTKIQTFKGICVFKKKRNFVTRCTIKQKSQGVYFRTIFSLFCPTINKVEVLESKK